MPDATNHFALRTARAIIKRVNKPIKVLHLAESPYFGGINAHIRNAFEAFRGSEERAPGAPVGEAGSERTDPGVEQGI